MGHGLAGFSDFCTYKKTAPMSEAGQKAKYSLRAHIVRFAPNSGLTSDVPPCPRSANSGRQHSHCDASQRGIYWRPSAAIEGGRYEPRAVNSGRQSSLRSVASRSACRATRLSYYGVAALADAEGAVAQSYQYHRYFYVLEGHMRLFLQDPKEEVNLKPGEIHVVRAARPHLVTNGGTKSLTFLVLQGIGEYDYVPLTSS